MKSATQEAQMPAKYEIKCDECKTTIGHTDSIRVSSCGGLCVTCRRSELAKAARAVAA